MSFFRSKRIQLLMTLIICLMIIAAGSVAWVSFTQKALNQFTFTPAGVNLHDDFKGGPNKDVYVENSGDEPVLVRIRFREYSEVGGARFPDDDDVGKDDPETWPFHEDIIIDPARCEIENADGENIHDRWTWIMGGGAKWYIPADNNKIYMGSEELGYTNDSEAATVKHKIEEDGLPTDLLPEYGSYADLNDAIEANTKLYGIDGLMFDLTDWKITLKEAALDEEVKAARDELNKLQAEINAELAQYGVRLTRPTERVLTMQQWLYGVGVPGDPDYISAMYPGDYWVVDEDGWCYWASPLEPGEATGLLLDEVLGGEELRNDRKRYYYGIDVIMQAATKEDIGEFYEPEATKEAAIIEIGRYGSASPDAWALLQEVAGGIVTAGEASGTAGRTARTAGQSTGETSKGKYWRLSGGVWKFYDGRWRFDGQDWTLDGGEYDFDPGGWWLSGEDWNYLDDYWIFDGEEWIAQRPASKPGEETGAKEPEPDPDPNTSNTAAGENEANAGTGDGDESGEAAGEKDAESETGGAEETNITGETDGTGGTDSAGDSAGLPGKQDSGESRAPEDNGVNP